MHLESILKKIECLVLSKIYIVQILLEMVTFYKNEDDFGKMNDVIDAIENSYLAD